MLPTGPESTMEPSMSCTPTRPGRPRAGPALALVALLVSAPGLAAAPLSPGAGAPGPADEGYRRVGVLLDLGAPDGVGLSLAYRVQPWLRFHAGPTTNTAGFGVRGGASLIPFAFPVAPNLNLEAGHYFPADYSGLVRRLGGDPTV